MNSFHGSHPTDAQIVMALDRELEPAETAALAQHLDRCAACRAKSEQFQRASDELQNYHRDFLQSKLPVLRTYFPSPAADRALSAGFWRALIATAALAAIVWFGLRVNRRHAPARPVVSQAVATPAIGQPSMLAEAAHPAVAHLRRRVRRDPAAPPIATFIELPFSDSALPLTDAAIVRVQLRAEDLWLAGLPVDSERAGSMIQADLILGIDGQPRAIQFVQ